MGKAVFITGTGTDLGKTYVTGLPTLAKVKDGDTELDMDVESLKEIYE